MLGQEATFAAAEPIAGEQIAFGRARVRVTGLEPGAGYRVTRPYGRKPRRTARVRLRTPRRGYPIATPEHNAQSVRRIAPLLVALVAVGAGGVRAYAWTPPPADDAGRLARFLPIARAAWPASPCAGREVVHLAADAALRAEAPAIAGPGEGLDGMASPDTCEVWLASRMDAATFCAVLTHELGHLAGRPHTTIARDVMNGAGDIDWPACDRATTPPPAQAAAEELRTVLPPPRAAWRISCGRRRAAQRRCVARRGATVRRYELTETRATLTVARAD